MSNFNRGIILTIVIILAGLFCAPQDASAARRSRADLTKRLDRSNEHLMDLMYYPDKAIPARLLAKAKAIVFIRQFKAGFIFGIRGGYAVSLLHDEKGNWSPPSFHRLGGGSVGLQIGGEQVDAVLLIMTREGTRMLTGESSEIGVDFAAVAGPIGRHKDISTLTQAPVLVYSKGIGLYAGATVQGGIMAPSRDSNEVYYDKARISALDILEGKVKMPKEAMPLVRQLKKYVLEGLKKED